MEAPGDELAYGIGGDGRIPQLKARSDLAVGMDHRSWVDGSVLASASSSDRNQVTPSACFVCRAQVSMRWPTCRLRPSRSA